MFNEEIKKIKNPLEPIMPTLDILISKFKAKAECTLNCGLLLDIYDNCFRLIVRSGTQR